MKILLVNQYAGSPNLGMEFRPHWMARQWLKLGHEVLIVAGDKSHLRRKPLKPGVQCIEGVDFFVTGTTSYSKNGVRRFLNILSFRRSLRKNRRFLADWRPDVVVSSSTHPMDARPALQIARQSGARYVHEVHDLWPLTPQLLGGISAHHPVIIWMKREEIFAYSSADAVVSILPGTEAHIRQNGLAAGNWIYIPNGIGEIPPSAAAPPNYVVEAVAELRKTYQRVMIYAGTLGVANALERLLRWLDHMKEMSICVVLIGSGPMRTSLMDLFGNHSNFVLLDPVPRESVVGALRLADAAYAGANPSKLYEYGVSLNKLFDYMAAGIPIFEDVGAANSPVSAARCGWISNPNQPEGLLQNLRAFAVTPREDLINMGRRGTEYVIEHHLEGKLASRMLDVLAGRGGDGEQP